MSIEALEAKAVRAYHAQRESETELAAIEVKEFIQDVIGVQPEEVHDKNYLWRIGPYFFGYEKSGHKIKITVRKFCEHFDTLPNKFGRFSDDA